MIATISAVAIVFASTTIAAVACARRLGERLSLGTKSYAFVAAAMAGAAYAQALRGHRWNEPWCPALVVGFVSAYTDIALGYIFDGVLLFGAVLMLAATASVAQLEYVVIGACGAGVLPLGLFCASRGRALGLGDVKLAILLGGATGARGAIAMLIVAAVSGGAVALVLLAARLRKRTDAIPFAPFLALGAWAAVSGVIR
ncbi:MAG: prepilin peptidase [Candidatus Tyrphobacter sp.]